MSCDLNRASADAIREVDGDTKARVVRRGVLVATLAPRGVASRSMLTQTSLHAQPQ
jgi:hypothetical protein